MARVSLSNQIKESQLIEFDLYNVKDSTAVSETKQLSDLEASDSLINFVIRQAGWSGVQRIVDNKSVIGYGTVTDLDGIGKTEAEAYSDWISKFKDTERKFKRIMPLRELSQARYDGLLSLFFHTGTIDYVGSEQRQFKIRSYILEEKWNYLCTALVLSGKNRLIRQGESRIIMLGDYGITKPRTSIKESGLQEIRKNYPDRFSTTQLQQAEYVYYAETQRFLPAMTQARKKFIVNLYNQNN